MPEKSCPPPAADRPSPSEPSSQPSPAPREGYPLVRLCANIASRARRDPGGALAVVSAYDRDVFQWHVRRDKLFERVAWHRVGCRERSPDVITLAECDHYDDFWRERFEQTG